jgi:hypothetical protein
VVFSRSDVSSYCKQALSADFKLDTSMELIKKYWIVVFVTFVICMFVKPAVCFLILGGVISYTGFAVASFLKKIERSGVDCTGNIVEYDSNSDGLIMPLIEFTTMTGEFVKEKPFVYASTELIKMRTNNKFIDQPVSILYDPDDPKKFILKNEEGFNYRVFKIFIIGGLFFIGLGIIWLLGYIKMA